MALAYMVSSLIISVILYWPMLWILKIGRCFRKNYRDVKIVNASGLLIFLVTILIFGFQLLFIFPSLKIYFWKVYPLLLLIAGASFLGLFDDLFGSREYLGFKGHFKALIQKKITSGLVKAVGGIILAFAVVSLISVGFSMIILNAIIIALSMNLFNLLDLRPGRALKYFIFLMTILLIFSINSFYWSFLAIIVGPIIILLFLDLREVSLLGDAGANTIGSIFGFILVVNFSINVKIMALIFLIGFHIFTEFYSFTELVRNNRLLNWFDLLGRKYKY